MLLTGGIGPSRADQPRAVPSPIEPREIVEFYPTYGRLDERAGQWTLLIHAHLCEPEHNRAKRALGLTLVRRLLGFPSGTSDDPIFVARAEPFLVDNLEDRRLGVVLDAGEDLGELRYVLQASADNGHALASIRLPADRLPDPTAGEPLRLTCQATLPEDDHRQFVGRIHLVSPEGLSIISDVDDTIRDSHVLDREAMLKGTFLEEFQPVEGMSELYAGWAAGGAAFHYVSAGPWQLYGAVDAFREREGFPAGSFHMRHFRLKDRSALDMLRGPDEYKRTTIESIMAAFPRRQFILVGDSGERDPEIYGDLARRFSQVRLVLIRNVTRERANGPRMRSALRRVTFDRWQLFDEPSEIDADAIR